MEIRILILRNIGPNQLPIAVGPPLSLGGTGTNPTDNDFAGLFPGEGTVILQPNKVLEVEEDRVNLGQIENLVSLGALSVRNTLRSVSDLTGY